MTAEKSYILTGYFRLLLLDVSLSLNMYGWCKNIYYFSRCKSNVGNLNWSLTHLSQTILNVIQHTKRFGKISFHLHISAVIVLWQMPITQLHKHSCFLTVVHNNQHSLSHREMHTLAMTGSTSMYTIKPPLCLSALTWPGS